MHAGLGGWQGRRTVVTDFVVALGFMERACCVPEAQQLARRPEIKAAADELRLTGAGDGTRGRRTAPRLPFAVVRALEGIVLDPVYTGKAFAGMLAELDQGRFAGCTDIVFIHTGGIFGVFPQRAGFQ